MQAEFEVKDGVIVVHLKGRLSYEWAGVFRSSCLEQLNRLHYEKIVFNLSELSFVGSSGINEFLETITELSSDKFSEIKFCGVAAEFQRIFQVSPLKNIEIYENDKKACRSFQLPMGSKSDVKKPFFKSSKVPQEFEEDSPASLSKRKK